MGNLLSIVLEPQNLLAILASLAVFATILTVYILQGHMAIELGGLELSVAPHEDGGVRLAVVRADHVSGLLPL